ncbi:MAG TPA: hypothetical protein VFU31_12745, partial [Candidatus Binatia bacterium]|nr:hypothetical protein [Candidatus Binatia bacterium]
AAASTQGLVSLGFIPAFALACTLIFQFRLWDDLESLEEDRLQHPERILSKAVSLVPFRAFLILLFTLNSVFLSLGRDFVPRLAAFLLLSGGLLCWYRGRRRVPHNKLADSHLILLKYPLFVYLITQPSQAGFISLGLSMSVVYLCFCIYEILHDRSLGSVPAARKILGLEIAGLIGLYAVMAAELMSHGLMQAIAQGLLTVVTLIALTWLFLSHRSMQVVPPGSILVFLLGYLQLFNFSLRGAL